MVKKLQSLVAGLQQFLWPIHYSYDPPATEASHKNGFLKYKILIHFRFMKKLPNTMIRNIAETTNAHVLATLDSAMSS